MRWPDTENVRRPVRITYGTKVIVPTTREAHYVLDDFLGNATDLPLAEHATDTHGVTLINFALFDLVDKALSGSPLNRSCAGGSIAMAGRVVRVRGWTGVPSRRAGSAALGVAGAA